MPWGQAWYISHEVELRGWQGSPVFIQTVIIVGLQLLVET